MSARAQSPAGALVRGLVAGAVGTAAMTAAQTADYKATGAEPSTTPVEVAKRIVGVLQREVPDDRTEPLDNGMHWLYGTSLCARRPTAGVALGLTVWGASLVELPAMGLAPPVWEWDAKTLGPDVGFHLVYGIAAASAHRALV